MVGKLGHLADPQAMTELSFEPGRIAYNARLSAGNKL